MGNNFLSFFRYLTLLAMALNLSAAANAAHNHDHSTVRLSGHIPTKALANSVFVENLEAGTNVQLTFTLPLRNKEELEELLQGMYDPSSPTYHKFLTTKEFHARFSPTQEDYDNVVAYAKSLGLTVKGTHPNRTLLNVSAQASHIEKAFGLSLHQYQLPSGRKFHAPSDDPQVPSHISTIISGIVGLDNHAVWRPYNRKKETGVENEAATGHGSPSGPNNGFSPADIVKAYNLTGLPVNGTGQVIALFELASYQASDINTYTSYFGLPAAQLKNVLVDGGSGTGIDPEVTLDIELALALSPYSQIYVYEGPNTNQGVLDTYNRIATDNIAKQVSTSWGMGEDNETTQYLQAESAIFQQMAAHGQTIYAAAGDSGAYDDSSSGSNALVVDDPASQPYVAGVGGTTLKVNQTSGAYVSEAVWNDGAGNGAGGGGVSTVWGIPAWQAKVTTVHSKTNRNVPDVALNADPNTGYAIFYNGQWTIYGGTSCAAPLWASFTACVNEERVANKLTTLGFVNPLLYSIAEGSAYTTNFNDVATGNNLYYSAGKGYDNASGWGSFNGDNLFATLTSTPAPQTFPDLYVMVQPTAPFTKGGTGTYAITVDNIGLGATSGQVTVAITLPAGLTYKSLSGTGWTFNTATLTCTRSTALGASSSYPPIDLVVNVGATASSPVTIQVTVSGGGSPSSTTTEQTSIF